MFPRPDIDAILTNTADNIVAGIRNPASSQDRHYWFNSTQAAFTAYTSDAGIYSSYDDISQYSTAKIGNSNTVTRFIYDRLELNVITLSDLNTKYFKLIEQNFFNNVVEATQGENDTYSQYIEEIL
jgi:hypothetical protein